jgi:hypothetical protein
MTALAREYVERRVVSGRRIVPRRGSTDTTNRSSKSKLSVTSGGTSGCKKTSRKTKAYIQAYQWSQTKLHGNQTSNKKQGATSVRCSASVGRVSAITEPALSINENNESLSETDSFPATPIRRFNGQGLRRDPMSAPLPTIPSPPTRRDERDSVTSASVRQYRTRIQSAPRSLSCWNIFSILSATTIIAICEHTNHLLFRTGLIVDLGLQFTACFVQSSCQVFVILYLISKLHRERESASILRRRGGFHDFMHSHRKNDCA